MKLRKGGHVRNERTSTGSLEKKILTYIPYRRASPSGGEGGSFGSWGENAQDEILKQKK